MHTLGSRRHARLHPEANQQHTCASREACTKSAKFWPNSPYCLYHRQRFYRYGTTVKTMPRDSDLARHRADIRHTLRLYRDSPTVQWALNVVTRELFDYRATHNFSHEHFIEARLKTLRDRGAAPLDVLQRYVECYSVVQVDGWEFETPRAYHSWVARKLIGLADGSMKGVHTNAKHMAAVGLTVHEALCRFAIATLQRVQRDKAAKGEANKALDEWAMK
jgi:hypothetical protein